MSFFPINDFYVVVFFLTLSSHFHGKYVIVSDSDSNHWKESVFSNVFSAAVVINNYLRMIIFRSWFKTTCESIAEKKSGPWQKN